MLKNLCLELFSGFGRVDFGRHVLMFFKIFPAPPPIPLGFVENPLTFYKFEGLKG